jgi:tetratricopeptide (TPR) repeat protein
MPLPHRPFRHRGILVALWLTFAVEFLAWRQPGFWRVPFRRYEAARTLADQGRVADAIAEMNHAVFEDASNAGYLTFKAFLESRAGRAEAARVSFTRALALGGDDIALRLGLADANVRSGRYDEAREILRGLPTADLTLEQRYQRQALFAVMADFEAALGDEALLDADLDDTSRLAEALRWALGARSWERAIAVADRVVASTSEASVQREALGSKALALDALGRHDEALAVYADIASPENLATRARLAAQLGRHQDAAPLYAELLQRRPDEGEVARNLAYSLGAIGRLQEAIAAFRTALAANDDPALRLQLVALLNATKAHESAWQALSPIPSPSTDPPTLRIQLRTAVWSGHLREAAQLLQSVSPLTRDDVTLAADLALALTAAGHGADGERIYRRLIDEGRAAAPIRERYAWWLSERRRYVDAWAVMRPVLPADLSERGHELQVRSAFWAEDYEAASPLLDQWLRTHPTHTEGWRDLAEAARQRKDQQTELRALDAYLQQRAGDTGAAARRAHLLDRAGRPDTALVAYAAVLEQAPGLVDTRRAYAFLLERTGRLDDAIREYETVWRADTKDPKGATSTAELTLVIARLARLSRRPTDAIAWYERALAAPGATPSARLLIEVAQTEIEAGRADAAHKRMDTAVRRGATDAETLAFAANAAVAAGNAARAAAHLEALGGQRPLTSAELRWQAGLYRSIGDRTRALAVYERLLASPSDEAEALDAMGDVHFELHDLQRAREAWSRARAGRTSPSVTLKLARLAAAQGRMDDAVSEYEQYVRLASPEGLRVELARAYLGVRRFDDAERWAREANEGGKERGLAATLVLAQALHLQGRVRESYALNTGAPKPDEETPELLELFGQLAAARHQHLRAIDLFDRARERGAERPGDLWMWSARSAIVRGDYVRAADRLDKAGASGVEPRFAPRVRAELDEAVSPAVAIPTRVFNDSNNIGLVQSGVRGRWFPERRFELSAEATRGELFQNDTGFHRTRALIGVSRALVTPSLAIDAMLGTETYERAGTLAIGRAGVTKSFRNTSSAGVRVSRDSMWSDHDPRDPRQFNRVLDLAGLGPAFHRQGISAFVDHHDAPLRQSFIEVGVEAFQDDNTHPYVYGHRQFVLQDRPGAWTALRPNVYWEHFSRPSPLYFSPRQFFSIGNMLHVVRGRGPWRLETEVNPRLTIFDSRSGFAINGLLDASREIGRTSVGGGAFVLYDDRSNYWAWRLAAQVGVKIGR